MTISEPRKRSAAVAGLFNALTLALGFVYLGKPRWVVATLLIPFAVLGVFAWTRVVFVPLGFVAAAVLMLGIWVASIVVAVGMARRQAPAPLAKFQRWYIYLGYLIVSGIAINAVMEARGRIFGYETFRFPSGSMEDTLQRGDFFLSDTWKFRDRDPERGELVVFLYPADPSVKYVKRVIALPGETVRLDGSEVRVDGKLLNEPYVNPVNNRGLIPVGSGEFRVPDRSYFVLGDNRDNSSDSRSRGFVPRENMHGSVEYVWFSRDLARVGLRVK